MTGISESGSSAVTYGYDALGHLTSDVRTGTNAYSKSYTVDGEGNRTGMTVGGTSSTFNYNNDDWLTSTTGGLITSYGYDNAGEQTSRTVGGVTYTLAYDYEGQLVSITHSTTTVSFTYDAEGRRMSRTSGGTTTNFLYDGGQVLLEAQGATYTAVYSYGNSLTRKDGEFPMFDGHGSERTVANSSQTVTGTLNLDAFGVQAGSTGSSTDPYMYAATSGYRNDGDVGLSLDGARYYDSAVGRFITRDTDLSQAPYCYCDGDPVNAVDANGHDPFSVIGGPPSVHLTLGCGPIGDPIQLGGQGSTTAPPNPGPIGGGGVGSQNNPGQGKTPGAGPTPPGALSPTGPVFIFGGGGNTVGIAGGNGDRSWTGTVIWGGNSGQLNGGVDVTISDIKGVRALSVSGEVALKF